MERVVMEMEALEKPNQCLGFGFLCFYLVEKVEAPGEPDHPIPVHLFLATSIPVLLAALRQIVLPAKR